MRALLCGASIGVLLGALCAGALAPFEPIPLPYKVGAPLAVAAATTLLLWARAALRAAAARFRRWRALRRARQERRAVVARARRDPNARPVHRGGLEGDEVTVPLDGAPPPARRPRRSADLAPRLAHAAAAAAHGDFAGAVELLTEVLDDDPDHLDARLARGRVLLDLGDYGRAMSDFVRAEELAPDDPEPIVAIGDLHFARKDYVRAIECFDIALSLAPEHAMAHCRRGMSHYHRTTYELALPDLLRAQALDPDIPNLASHVLQARRKVDDLRRAKATPARAKATRR